MEASPAKLELSIPPGTTYSIPLTIRNNSPVPTHIQVSLSDFSTTLHGDANFPKVGSRPDSLMRWASINPREFDLPANTVQQVRLSLQVPNKDISGEYAGIVFFQTRPIRRAAAVAFSLRIATKIYASIPGTDKINGSVTKMNVLASGDHPLYHVLFRNTGNVHEYITGQLLVQKNGETIDRIAMPQNMLVERGEDLLIELSGKSLPPGQYQAVAMIDYGGKTMTGGEVGFAKK